LQIIDDLAGIYVHIPFCKTICHYCDFYKTANLKTIDVVIDCILKEIELKKSWISENVSTIYFGGGTPSVLNINQLSKIIDFIFKNFSFDNELEITIEVNPDDVSIDYLKQVSNIGFNRLSIGIQSFNDDILKFLNRRHNSYSAKNAIENAKNAGFNDVSIDLIYGIPGQTVDDFLSDLRFVSDSGIQHLSAYHLGIESNTRFGKLNEKGILNDIDEDLSEKYYTALINWANSNSFEHYEISSFARNFQYSRHNKSYWFGIPYLGFGPSAHSFDRNYRYFNFSNTNKYVNAILENKKYYDQELLSDKNKYNEFVMLRLRTKWGFNLLEIKDMISNSDFDKILRRIKKFQDSDYLRIIDNMVILTEKGLFLSDFIIKDLII
jgi:oxygen-independent coproporphyrinogen-3 oxidase